MRVRWLYEYVLVDLCVCVRILNQHSIQTWRIDSVRSQNIVIRDLEIYSFVCNRRQIRINRG